MHQSRKVHTRQGDIGVKPCGLFSPTLLETGAQSIMPRELICVRRICKFSLYPSPFLSKGMAGLFISQGLGFFHCLCEIHFSAGNWNDKRMMILPLLAWLLNCNSLTDTGRLFVFCHLRPESLDFFPLPFIFFRFSCSSLFSEPIRCAQHVLLLAAFPFRNVTCAKQRWDTAGKGDEGASILLPASILSLRCLWKRSLVRDIVLSLLLLP